MPALSFQRRFVSPIRAGLKRHTIRDNRKVPIKIGDRLYLFTGMRTKACERIFPGYVLCTRVERVEIGQDRVMGAAAPWLKIAGQLLDASERESLAKADGFQDWPEMLSFWDGRLPFAGHIIYWSDPQDGE